MFTLGKCLSGEGSEVELLDGNCVSLIIRARILLQLVLLDLTLVLLMVLLSGTRLAESDSSNDDCAVTCDRAVDENVVLSRV